MTKEQREKSIFVKHFLYPLLHDIDKDIVDVIYLDPDDMSDIEIVEVTWKNGYKRGINVTADSKSAIARDVLKSIS